MCCGQGPLPGGGTGTEIPSDLPTSALCLPQGVPSLWEGEWHLHPCHVTQSTGQPVHPCQCPCLTPWFHPWLLVFHFGPFFSFLVS